MQPDPCSLSNHLWSYYCCIPGKVHWESTCCASLHMWSSLLLWSLQPLKQQTNVVEIKKLNCRSEEAENLFLLWSTGHAYTLNNDNFWLVNHTHATDERRRCTRDIPSRKRGFLSASPSWTLIDFSTSETTIWYGRVILLFGNSH